jgi:hypothetical protein
VTVSEKLGSFPSAASISCKVSSNDGAEPMRAAIAESTYEVDARSNEFGVVVAVDKSLALEEMVRFPTLAVSLERALNVPVDAEIALV